MFLRPGRLALALVTLTLGSIGCGTPGLSVIKVSPATQTLTAAGETVQFTAVGLFHGGTSSKDITNLVTWKSSDVAVATINSAGLATAISPGQTTITASMQGVSGIVSSTAGVTVGAFIGPSLGSLTVIPANQPTTTVNETAQFIAVGSFGTSGGVQDLTNLVTWISSDVAVGTVTSSGLVTALGPGITYITAVAKGSDGTVLTATSTFTVLPFSGTPIPTLSIYKVGNNASISLVTAPDPNNPTVRVINCGLAPGCVGHFTAGSVVTMTETPGTSTFGGWSDPGCLPVPIAGTPPPTTCTVTIQGNQTVGAIFN